MGPALSAGGRRSTSSATRRGGFGRVFLRTRTPARNGRRRGRRDRPTGAARREDGLATRKWRAGACMAALAQVGAADHTKTREAVAVALGVLRISLRPELAQGGRDRREVSACAHGFYALLRLLKKQKKGASQPARSYCHQFSERMLPSKLSRQPASPLGNSCSGAGRYGRMARQTSPKSCVQAMGSRMERLRSRMPIA